MTTRLERILVGILAAILGSGAIYLIVVPGIRAAQYVEKCTTAKVCPSADDLDKRIAELAAMAKAQAEAAVKAQATAPPAPSVPPAAPVAK